MATLKDFRADNFYAVQLNPDEFSEWITYRRPGSDDRSIVAHIQTNRHQQKDDHQDSNIDEILARVGKIEDHSSGKGGVAKPQLTDQILRDTFVDGEPVYVFTGEIRDEKPHCWTLVFRRYLPYRLGKR